MATLEKIRSKSVLLIVIIGVALLAFIVGDALTNSRTLFGEGTVVAKIGGDKIDYTEYQQKREELNQQLEQARRQNPEQFANYDTQQLAQLAIDQLVAEHLLDDAVKKAGIKSSPELLRFYILESGQQNQDLTQIMQGLAQSGINAATPQQAYEDIFNPKANGLTDAQVAPFRDAWLAMENNVKQQIVRQTYQRLLAGSIRANNLDKHALHNDYVTTNNIALAYKPFGQLSEKDYPVSDADINKAYDAEKGKFKVDEQFKDVSFIAVSVAPSQKDINEARQLANRTVAALSDSTSGQLSKDLKKNGIAIERRELRLSDINDAPVREFVASAAPNAVKLVQEGRQGFTIVRMGKRSARVDSIQLNIVQIAGNKLPAKVLAALNGGLAIDSISKRFSPDSVMAQQAQWIPLFSDKGATNALQQSQLDSLLNAGGKYITLVNEKEGAVIAAVAKQAPAKEIVDFEQVVYDLKPSANTLAAARTKLEKFLAANNTAQLFNKNAAKAGYTIQNLSVSQSSAAMPRMNGMQNYFPDSRQVVRWVMIDGKVGEVSHIYESKDALAPMLYAVAIDREYKDYIPASNPDVKKYLTEKVRRDKAGDKMLAQYKSKAGSVASAAAAMGVQPADVQVRFGQNGQINDPAVMGRIMGSKAGKTQILKGRDGIYVFQVKGAVKENFPYNDEQFDRNYMQLINPDMTGMLRGTKKFKNNAYKFEAGD